MRKAEKAHGTGRRIEGFCRAGARVVIVDDVCTTGASTINAIEAAKEAGMKVAAVVCIVEREEANGRPAVEAAADGAPFLRLFTANEVRAEHVRQMPARGNNSWILFRAQKSAGAAPVRLRRNCFPPSSIPRAAVSRSRRAGAASPRRATLPNF